MRKNKSTKYIILITLFLIELISIFLAVKSFSNRGISEIEQVNEVDKKKFAMYIQQENGEYLESISGRWPTENYLLNTERSTCVDSNGEEVNDVLSYSNGTVYLNSKKTVFCYVYFDIGNVCEIASDSTVAAGTYGAKYNCKVDPNKDRYTFYLIDNNTDGTSDLIMNANINASGEAVILGASDKGTVAWYADEANNINGPVTALDYLYNATKSWTNVEPVNYSYYDRESQGITVTDRGYVSFVSVDGIATITKGDSTGTQVTIGTVSEPLRTRMPIYLENNSSETEVSDKTDANAFLYENLNVNSGSAFTYWTLSSFNDGGSHIDFAWVVYNSGYLGDGIVSDIYYSGVRPVITVNLN